jgi:hypothetical protein
MRTAGVKGGFVLAIRFVLLSGERGTGERQPVAGEGWSRGVGAEPKCEIFMRIAEKHREHVSQVAAHTAISPSIARS